MDAIASTDAHRVEQRAGGAQLSAYGRGSSGKPIYTRDQIQQLYRAHQKGAFRDDWARQEANIIAASREGRIQAAYSTK